MFRAKCLAFCNVVSVNDETCLWAWPPQRVSAGAAGCLRYPVNVHIKYPDCITSLRRSVSRIHRRHGAVLFSYNLRRDTAGICVEVQYFAFFPQSCRPVCLNKYICFWLKHSLVSHQRTRVGEMLRGGVYRTKVIISSALFTGKTQYSSFVVGSCCVIDITL